MLQDAASQKFTAQKPNSCIFVVHCIKVRWLEMEEMTQAGQAIQKLDTVTVCWADTIRCAANCARWVPWLQQWMLKQVQTLQV